MLNTAQSIPNHPHAQQILELMAASRSLCAQNRHEEALSCCEKGASIDPGFFPVLVEKGIVLFELSRYEESIECFDIFLKYISNSQVRELRESCMRHVLADYDRILAASGPNVELLLKRGDILQRLNRNDEAVDAYDLALEINGNGIADILNRRGNSLLYLDRANEALESYSRALELAPGRASLLYNRANVLQKLGRIDEALKSYAEALTCKPDLAEAKLEQSHCRLVTGDFKRGFMEYESRWETAQLKSVKLKSNKPLWLGEANLAGKTILLWAEQGYGDTIQFMRYVPLVAKSAGLTILRVPAALRSLAQTLDCPLSVITPGDSLPPHDYNCPLMSLPLAFGTTLESIPANVPYLRAEPDQIEKWRSRLEGCSRPKIGLVWAGRRREPVNRTRDMRLEVIADLTRFDAEIISLQKEIPDEDGKMMASVPQIRREGEKLSDFADTAGLIQNLDIVISVDSAVAHLAGALGKPVWIMLRHAGEWRWLIGRRDSPWYPTALIFRQKTPGDWAGVVSDITLELQGFIG